MKEEMNQCRQSSKLAQVNKFSLKVDWEDETIRQDFNAVSFLNSLSKPKVIPTYLLKVLTT